LLNALLRARLSALELRIVLWVLRHTCGWNRSRTPFTWYGLSKNLNANRGTVFRAGKRLLQSSVLRYAHGQLGIQQEFNSWDGAIVNADPGAQQQRWITRARIAKKQRKPLLSGNATVATEQRFSVERKTGVKTVQKRSRGGGYVDNAHSAENDAARELMNFYGASRGKALSGEEAARFSHSAKALLEACSNNLQEAKALLRQFFAKAET
jgi:phage replication O-like protein O